MADDREDGRPGEPKQVSVGFSVGGEWTADVDARMKTPVETLEVFLGWLEDLSDDEARAFYARALDSLPTTRVHGFYGVVDGGPERSDDVVLLMYEHDKKTPVLKLTMSRENLARFSDALAGLVATRFRSD